jgi:hypothetical protein
MKKKKEWRDWKSLKFYNWTVGMGVKNEQGYIKAGITKPFSVYVNDGSKPKTTRWGFSAEGGIKLKVFLIGLFYKYTGFEDADAKMIQSGLFIGYSFK